jgi:hypothetical protein
MFEDTDATGDDLDSQSSFDNEETQDTGFEDQSEQYDEQEEGDEGGDYEEGDNLEDGDLTSQNKGPVPYHRFYKTNVRAKRADELEADWGELHEYLKENGITNARDAFAEIQRNNEAQQAKQIRQKWAQKAYNEGLDEETETERANLEIEKLQLSNLRSRLLKDEQARQTEAALTQFPLAKEARPLFDAMVSKGLSPVEAAKIVEDTLKTATKSATTQQAARKKAPAVMGGRDTSGRPVRTGQGTAPRHPSQSSFFSLLRGNKT